MHELPQGSADASTDLPPSETAAAPERLAPIRDAVATMLRTSGVLAGLGYLNGRVRFRYTGVFRPDPPLLHNIRLFDRENPSLNVSGNAIALLDGYCGIACSTNAPFATSDSLKDPRLRSHPARESMRSYAGVPIRIDGAVWGTLCHYDMRPRVIPPNELHVLEEVMPFFADWVRAHVTPS